MYEMVYNLFAQPHYKPTGVRAQDINTVDEVPDSSWFTNRIGAHPLTIDELVRGPIAGAPPDPSRWVISREKTSGVHPGVTAKDAKRRNVVPAVRPEVLPGSRDGVGHDGHEVFLGARLQPG
jgi:hypothetical protein